MRLFLLYLETNNLKVLHFFRIISNLRSRPRAMCLQPCELRQRKSSQGEAEKGRAVHCRRGQGMLYGQRRCSELSACLFAGRLDLLGKVESSLVTRGGCGGCGCGGCGGGLDMTSRSRNTNSSNDVDVVAELQKWRVRIALRLLLGVALPQQKPEAAMVRRAIPQRSHVVHQAQTSHLPQVNCLGVPVL
jgi:hypothetical protein